MVSVHDVCVYPHTCSDIYRNDGYMFSKMCLSCNPRMDEDPGPVGRVERCGDEGPLSFYTQATLRHNFKIRSKYILLFDVGTVAGCDNVRG